jgi:enediyne biosynthesis protein E4
MMDELKSGKNNSLRGYSGNPGGSKLTNYPSLPAIAPLVVLFLLAGLFSLGFPAAATAQQFSEVGSSLALPSANGGAWGDYNNDGYPDLYLGGVWQLHGPALLHNNGDGGFSDVTAAMGLPTAYCEDDGVAWGDYNDDGKLDLLVSQGNGPLKLYRNDTTTFTNVTVAAGLTMPNGGRGVAWGDYDRDGWLDFAVCDLFRPLHLYHNNGNGTFTDVAAAAGVGSSATTTASVCSWADFSGDGWPDLLVVKDAGIYLYLNNRNGAFTDGTAAANFGFISQPIGLAIGDYDNDGYLDFYLTTARVRPNYLFHNNGNGTFTNLGETLGMPYDYNLGCAWADYDNDTWADLFASRYGTSTNPVSVPFLLHNEGDGTFTDVAASEGVTLLKKAQVAIWGDYDVDGKPDLLAGASPQAAALYHNIGDSGNWLRVLPLTNAAGNAGDPEATVQRVAIGARVEVNLDNDPQFPQASTLVRLIDGGSSFLGQNEPVAQFGLGDTSLVAVRVLFPSGDVEVSSDVAANQQIYLGDLPSSLGDLAGSVVTRNGDPLPSVGITCGIYSAVTQTDGSFSIPDMSADATYAFTAHLTGYWPVTVRDVNIVAGETTNLAPIILDPLGVPLVLINDPVANSAKTVSYTVTYPHADAITLSAADLTLNRTGTATGILSITGNGNSTRTVTISKISGKGTLGISITAGTASNVYGLSPAAGPSTAFTLPIYRLKVTAKSSKGGAVSGAGYYANGATATVSATPKAGWAFDHWKGPVADPYAATTTVVMDRNLKVTAVFAH